MQTYTDELGTERAVSKFKYRRGNRQEDTNAGVTLKNDRIVETTVPENPPRGKRTRGRP